MDDKIKIAIDSLNKISRIKYDEAIQEGHKNEVCTKCNNVLLAHHHFVWCDCATFNQCPMSSNKTVFEILNDEEKENI